MNFTNIKLTQNQQLIANALLSMLASAFVAAAQAGYQYVTQHGVINLSQAFLVFVGALWVSFSAALVAYVPAHVQQELEAWKDTAALAQSELARIEGKQQPATSVPAHVLDGKTLAQEMMPYLADAIRSSVVAIPPRPKPQPAQPQQIALTNPTGGSTVAVPMPEAPQQVWLSTTMSGSSGVQQSTQDDVLGDLPASTGQPMQVNQITGVVPVYGASGK